MLGVLLTSFATLLGEISVSIGKAKVKAKEESMFTMGFLSTVGAALFFAIIALVKPDSFVFVAASLPIFLPRVFLEIFQAFVTFVAITKADRSAFGFIRVGTIPLLLVVDLVLGYSIRPTQFLGIAILIFTILYLLKNHGINPKGMGWILVSTVNAVITISLYKYNITHFNSVVAEELIIFAVLAVVFFASALIWAKENPLRVLRKPIFSIEALTDALGGVVHSFAYSFAPASIILAATRSSSIFWSVISGNRIFHESKALLKLISLAILILGILLLL